MVIEITVRGTFSAFEPPERGTARATLGLEGPQLQPVFERVVQALEQVKASVGPLHDPERGPVTWWATQQIRTWAQRPWNKDGKQLPLVHHAAVGIEVKFRDFAALGRWVSEHVDRTHGFSLDGVTWALTEKRKQELVRQVRTRAVQDAAGRAQQYADAIGLGPVRPVAVADAGMLGAGLHPELGGPAGYARAASMSSTEAGLDLAPEDIEVAASVDARFVAD
jgi:uncharacterized protein YggE